MISEPGRPSRSAALAGQVAIVTGGGSGIGRAICRVLAEAGAAVAVVDVDRDRADDVAAGIGATGGSSIACEADVSEPVAVREVVAHTHERLGRVDVLVNSAGIIAVEPLFDVSPESWRRTFAVNVEGPLLMTQAVARVMRAQDPHPATGCRGKVINVSSAAAEEGRPLLPAYGASKAALNHLSKTCALTLGKLLIATTVLYPGDVADGMWGALPQQIAAVEGVSPGAVVEARVQGSPLGRFQTAREVAAMALFIASHPGVELNGAVLWATPHVSPL